MHFRIKHKFRQRITEWGGSAILTFLGLIIIAPGDSFSLSPSFDLLKAIMSETDWGAALLIAGFARFLGLFINGSMEAVTPWIRVIGAIVGFTFFALIFFSMAIAATFTETPWSTGLAVYGVLAVMELAAMYLAVIDARVYQNGRRSRPR